MSKYYKDISKFFLEKIKMIFKNVAIVCDDPYHISFIANNRHSRQINIYRLTSMEDVNKSIELICNDLAPVY